MSLATREQKAVVTDFCACRAFLLLFERQKGDTKIRLNKEKLTGHRGAWSKHPSFAGEPVLTGRTQNLLSLVASPQAGSS